MARKSVLWIVTDHQAFANRGVDPELFPLQARLRRIGTEFTRAHTVLPICSPARASMLTGLYPHTHGLTENDGRFGGRAELDSGDAMIQHDFAAAGYRCGFFGKWHLCRDNSATDFGFEGFSLPGYGYPYATPEYRDYLATLIDGPLWAVTEIPGEAGLGSGHRIDMTRAEKWFDYEAGSANLHGPEEVHEAHFLANMATDWLKELKADEPFCLRVDTWGPHPPYTIPSGFASPLGDVPLSGNLTHDLTNRPSHHAEYRDAWKKDLPPEGRDWPGLTRRAIEHCIVVERALVRLVDCLESTGKLENTVIVFCADHGDAVASNGGVMNKGGLLVEETSRIPMFFAGPGIMRGQCSDLFSNVDIAPTLHEICEVRTDRRMQGVSAAAALTGAGSPPAREHLMSEHYGLHVPILQRCLHAEDWKYVIQPDGFEEFYNLADDPYERRNLAMAGENPTQIAVMRRTLLSEMDALGDSDPRLNRLKRVLSGSDQ